MNSNSNRLESLDILRALAILGMVLSGYVAYSGILPAWMYHAQLPPPTHSFNPNLAGLTWVDLVFPMFLFTMGVAIPLSLHKKMDTVSLTQIFPKLLKRFFLLVFFAIYFQHIKPYSFAKSPELIHWILSVVGFVFLLGAFGGYHSKLKWKYTQLSFILTSIGYVFLLPVIVSGYEIKLLRSDIIILILSNVALVGSLVWIITRHQLLYRVLAILLVVSLKLGGEIAGSWTQELWTFDGLNWLFRISFLEYLVIVLVGTIVADKFLAYQKSDRFLINSSTIFSKSIGLIGVIGITVISLMGLYLRWDAALLIGQCAIAIPLILFSTKPNSFSRQLMILSTFLLVIGMVLEPVGGGIKKDPTMFSYLFVTSGISGMLFFGCLCGMSLLKSPSKIRMLIETGQNPMIAYVVPAILITPILGVTGLDSMLNMLNANAWLGFLKGAIITIITLVITSLLTRSGIILKT